MKYAIIADVHGNYPALRAVLEDAGEKGITRFLFAGDYCISGPWPEECMNTIREIEEKTVIRGNEEKYLENLQGKDPAGWTDGQMQASYYAFRNLSPENREYLLAQPERADFEVHGVPVHMAHSSVDFIGTRAFYTWNSVTVAERSRLPGADPERILAGMRDEREKDPAPEAPGQKKRNTSEHKGRKQQNEKKMDDGGGLPFGRQHDDECLRRQHRFPAGTAGTDRGGTRRDRRRGAGISRGGDWSGGTGARSGDPGDHPSGIPSGGG